MDPDKQNSTFQNTEQADRQQQNAGQVFQPSVAGAGIGNTNPPTAATPPVSSLASTSQQGASSESSDSVMVPFVQTKMNQAGEYTVPDPTSPPSRGVSLRRGRSTLFLMSMSGLAGLMIAAAGIAGWMLFGRSETSSDSAFRETAIEISGLEDVGPIQGEEIAARKLTIQGSTTIIEELTLGKSAVLTPISAPTSPKIGQLYYDQALNQIRYYNGTDYIGLGEQGEQGPAGPAGADGQDGVDGGDGDSSCIAGSCVSLQATTPGTQETGHLNISGTGIFGAVQGDGSALTNLNASNVTSGTLADARLSTNVALLNRNSQTFTGTEQLFRNSTNSTSALRVQTASSGDVLTVDTTNIRVGIGVAAPSSALHVQGGIRATALVSCDTIDTDASGNFMCGSDATAGAGAANLQQAYESQNTLNLTAAEGDLAVTLTSANVTFTTPTGGTNSISITRADGAGTGDPAQLLLLENQDTDRVLPIGIKIQSAAGGITTALDVSDDDIITGIALGGNVLQGTTASIDFTNFDVTASGVVTAASTGTFQGASVTIGAAAQAGSLILNDGATNTGTLQIAALGQSSVFTLPDPGGAADTVCLVSLGNCAGSGSGVTTTGGTINRLAKFTGSQAIGDSLISDDGTTVRVNTTSNSTTTFVVQNASSNTLLSVDSTNSRVNTESLRPVTSGAISQAAQATTVDSSNNVGGHPAIGIGSDGLPQIAYEYATLDDLKFAKCNNISCSSTTITTVEDSTVINEPDLVIGSDGFARIVYHGTNNDLKFVKCTNATCSSRVTQNLDTGNARHPSIKIGSDGNPRIAYRENNSGSIRFIQCTAADCSSTSGTSEIAANPSGASEPSMTLTSGNLARVVYVNSLDRLAYIECTNTACSTRNTQTLDSTGTSSHPSIQIGSDDLARIAYSRSGVRYIRCTNTLCSTSSSSLVNATGTLPTLAVASNDRGRIVYKDVNNVVYATCNDADCTAPTKQNVYTNAAEDPDIALDENDNAYIANYDNSAQDLVYINVSGESVSGSGFGASNSYYGVSYARSLTVDRLALTSTLNNSRAFYVQDASNLDVFSVNTANRRVTVSDVLRVNGGHIQLQEVTAPSATSGYGKLFVKSSDSKLYFLDDGGTEYDLTSGGSGGTLQGAYDSSMGGTTPEIKLDSTRGALDIQDADTTLGANLLNVRGSNGAGLGSVLFSVNSSGVVTVASTGTFQGASVAVGTSSQSGSLILNDGSSNTGTLQTAALAQNSVYTLPDPGGASDTVCLLTLNNCAGGGGVSGSGATGQVAFWSGASSITGNNNLFWDSGNTRLGLGTNTPSTKLALVGTTDLSARVLVNSTGVDSNAGMMLQNDARSWLFQVQGGDSDKLYIHDQTAGATRIAINNTGDVGIGTTSPGITTGAQTVTLETATEAPWLELSRTSDALPDGGGAGGVLWHAGTARNQIAAIQGLVSGTSENAGHLQLMTATGGTLSERIRVTSNGFTGVNETLPTEILVSKGNASNYALMLDNSSSDGSTNKWRITPTGAAWGAGDNRLIFTYETTSSTASLLTLNGANSTIGIGTNNAESRLQVTGGGLCVGSDANCNTDNNTEGVIYSSSTAMTVYDVAENYPTKDTDLTPGEIVTLDKVNGVFVKRSATANDPDAIGAISEEPGVLLGGFNGQQFKEEHQVAVALSGRILVKVSTENGPIAIGDEITTSSTPGVGMKATQPGTRVIGTALGSYSDEGVGKVMVFVEPGYYYQDPAETLQAGNFNDINVGNLATVKNLVVTDTIQTVNLVVSGHIKGNEDTRGTVTVSSGATEGEIQFASAYNDIPHVLVVPKQDVGSIRYWVTEVATGFKVHLSAPAPSEFKFNYMVQE